MYPGPGLYLLVCQFLEQTYLISKSMTPHPLYQEREYHSFARFVIHLGEPDNIIDFVQESGCTQQFKTWSVRTVGLSYYHMLTDWP